MPSEKGTVHIIDDDDALRESLAFLLRTARPRPFWRKFRAPR
jgi:FixJ family two-component response regulator